MCDQPGRFKLIKDGSNTYYFILTATRKNHCLAVFVVVVVVVFRFEFSNRLVSYLSVSGLLLHKRNLPILTLAGHTVLNGIWQPVPHVCHAPPTVGLFRRYRWPVRTDSTERAVQ